MIDENVILDMAKLSMCVYMDLTTDGASFVTAEPELFKRTLDGVASYVEIERILMTWLQELKKKGIRVLEFINPHIDDPYTRGKAACVFEWHEDSRVHEKTIGVAFRGSHGWRDYFMNDIAIVLTKLPFGSRGVKVTDGLLNCYSIIRHDVITALCNAIRYGGMKDVQNNKKHRPGPLRLLLTGHSLGGALATLCAYDLLYASKERIAAELGGYDFSVDCVTFGAPLLFNAKFKEKLVSNERLCGLRVCAEGDLICSIPPNLSSGMAKTLFLSDPVQNSTVKRADFTSTEHAWMSTRPTKHTSYVRDVLSFIEHVPDKHIVECSSSPIPDDDVRTRGNKALGSAGEREKGGGGERGGERRNATCYKISRM